MTDLDLDIQFVSGLVAQHDVPLQECWHALENLVSKLFMFLEECDLLHTMIGMLTYKNTYIFFITYGFS